MEHIPRAGEVEKHLEVIKMCRNAQLEGCVRSKWVSKAPTLGRLLGVPQHRAEHRLLNPALGGTLLCVPLCPHLWCPPGFCLAANHSCRMGMAISMLFPWGTGLAPCSRAAWLLISQLLLHLLVRRHHPNPLLGSVMIHPRHAASSGVTQPHPEGGRVGLALLVSCPSHHPPQGDGACAG